MSLIQADNHHLFIGPDEGILYVSTNDFVHHLIPIKKQTLFQLPVNNVESIQQAKYIGNQDLYNEKIMSVEGLNSKISRKEFTQSQTEIYFNEKTGKIRYSRPDVVLTKKKVLIIDDSVTIQKLLTKIINKSKSMEVAAVASCPSEAKKILESTEIDLVTLDIHMPEMNGIDFLKSYLRFLNKKVIMISAVSLSEGSLVLEALTNGAITYIQKPSVDDLDNNASDIIEKLECSFIAKKIDQSTTKNFSGFFTHTDGIVFIGSSTGGTQALEQIFTNLPAQIPPILVVQHIPAIFSKALADRLNSICKFTVCEAVDGASVQPNTIYIAPGGKQMRLRKRKETLVIETNDDPPMNRFKPSVDYFFDSVNELQLSNAIAIILTGMGKDGANSLLRLKNSGVFTMAQDEASSVVFGMPREAIRIGAATAIVGLSDFPREIVKNFNQFKSKQME